MVLIGTLGLAACATGDDSQAGPHQDGVNAAWRHWQPSGDEAGPDAVILALHGFNDYSNAFQDAAAFLSQKNIAVHAYDQRGFGANPDRGRWAGMERLTGDLKAAVARLRGIYGDLPLYVLGESMGGAVTIIAATQDEPLDADGLILTAPAVWGGQHMNSFYRLTLWIASSLAPGWALGSSGLDIRPSDNVEMLRAFSADPLVIKSTRTDAIAGLVALMDRALASASKLDRDLLLLVGEKDEVVPLGAFDDFEGRLRSDGVTVVSYPDGYHMLLRDLQRSVVFEDILAWIARQEPSENAKPAGPSIDDHTLGRTRLSKIKP